jgi:hypothetical protein
MECDNCHRKLDVDWNDAPSIAITDTNLKQWFCSDSCRNTYMTNMGCHFDRQDGNNGRIAHYKNNAPVSSGKSFADAVGITTDMQNVERAMDKAGLGLAVSGAKVLGGLVKGAADVLKDSEEDKARRVASMWENFNKADFSNTKLTIKGIDRLFGVFNDAYQYSNDLVRYENRREIAAAALAKIGEGIERLRNAPDGDPKKLDELQIKLQKTKLKQLEIKPDTGIFDSEDSDVTAYNRNITIINTVSFEGGALLIAKSLDSLFKIGDSLFSLIGDGKEIESDDKRKLCDAAITKIQAGIELLKQDAQFDAKKTAAFEEALEKLRANRNSIKAVQDGEYDAKAAMAVVSGASLEGGVKVVSSALDSLFKVCDSLFSIMGNGKKFASFDKRKLCNAAIPKIQEGIELLKQNAQFDGKKLAAYEAGLAALLVNRNGIQAAEEAFDEKTAQGIIDNVSLEGNSAFITAGIDALFSIKDAMFSLLGHGKEIYAEPKRQICDAAIAKIRDGIEALRGDSAFDVKKLAKYEDGLADFQQKRDTIKKVGAEKQAEQMDAIKQQFAGAGNQMKDQLKGAFGGILGGGSKGGLGGGLGALGGMFGKKDKEEETGTEAQPEADAENKLKQGLGGLVGGLGKGGLFGKKK